MRILLVLMEPDGTEWMVPALTADEATSTQKAVAIPVQMLQDLAPLKMRRITFVQEEDAAKLPVLDETWKGIRINEPE